MNINSQTDTLSRKERDKLRNKQAILEAAVHIFGQKGFADTKLEDVAARAEFGKGTLYNYFENKDHLLLCTFEYAVNNVLDFLYEQLSSVDDPMERIGLIANSQFAYYQKNTNFMNVIMTNQQLLMHHPASRSVFERFQELKKLVVKEMQAAIDAGQLRPGNPKHYASYLSGMIHAQVRSLRAGELPEDQMNADEIIDIFLNGAKS
ncbi:MAG: TetR/AcrR family transcriptional regulator [Candidatus Marinimicrobia bacterium]|nr:TetR/AcrR family transcriptional regulator [Candidatus Neomarinimicrobiota bacterium]